jgi:hypothetical protein
MLSVPMTRTSKTMVVIMTLCPFCCCHHWNDVWCFDGTRVSQKDGTRFETAGHHFINSAGFRVNNCCLQIVYVHGIVKLCKRHQSLFGVTCLQSVLTVVAVQFEPAEDIIVQCKLVSAVLVEPLCEAALCS